MAGRFCTDPVRVEGPESPGSRDASRSNVQKISKLQHPTSREAPNSNIQHAEQHQGPTNEPRFWSGLEVWKLELEYSLDIGCWKLELPCRSHPPHTANDL